MKCRLGPFACARLDPALLAALTRLTDLPRRHGNRGAAHLLERWRARLLESHREFDETPDLFDVLPAQSHDRSWLEVTVDVLHPTRRKHMQLEQCLFTNDPGGSILLGFVDRSLTDVVRTGDVVAAGVSIYRSPERDLSIQPRYYRKVCSNGQIRPEKRQRQKGSWRIEERIEASLDRSLFEAFVRDAKLAGQIQVHDPESWLDDELGDPAILERFRNSGDPTAWGLANAVTAQAHVEEDPSRAVFFEVAGMLVMEKVTAGSDHYGFAPSLDSHVAV